MLYLTIYSYKKAGFSDDEYRSYMLQTHDPLVSTLMEKYDIVDFTMVSPFNPILPLHSFLSLRTRLRSSRHT
jgi:hypothetical protein